MSNFKQEKEDVIKQLKSQGELIDKIIQENSRVNLLSNKQITELEHLQKDNRHLLHKLESGEFEIAIVGLEKAGKSTFSNALIEKDILPHASERCTFTSTRLKSGNDKAVAEFYTEQEFNDIFKSLLKEIKYPNAENASYKTLGINEFDKYFESLQNTDPNLYKAHYGSTYKEIQDIINYHKGLILTGTKKEFSGQELESADFKEFITGKKVGNDTDTAKPRSIKNLEIESSKLNRLEEAIIYDVPGFDSPTRIHRRQTEERLKSADAIILVTNVGMNPSIQGTSLDILHSTDDDGIELKDKLFVFGNQLDRAATKNDVSKNPEILRNDVKKHNIGRNDRVFVGSAKKHLVEKNSLSDPEYQDKFDIPANIDAIFNALIKYYETDRFDNLKNKIKKNQFKLKSLFKQIIESNERVSSPIDEDSELHNASREKQREITNKLEQTLHAFIEHARKTILEEGKLKDKFKDEIDNEVYFKQIEQTDFDEMKTKHTRTTNKDDMPLNKINAEIRKKLYERVLADNKEIISKITVKEEQYWYEKLTEDFLHSVKVVPFSVEDEQKAERLTQELLRDITGGISQQTEKFSHLINRFARNVFDAVIEHPLFDKDRNEIYNNRKAEFAYLDNYYNQGKGANGELISMILTQSKTDFIKEIRNNFKKDSNSLINALGKQAINIFNLDPAINVAYESVKTFLDKNTISLNDYSSNEIIGDKNNHNNYSVEGVINEINTDISNLKEILKYAVVEAVQLDYAFFTSLDMQVKLLIDAIDSKSNSTSNQKIFDKYISQIVKIIIDPISRDVKNRIEIRNLEIEFLNGMKQYVE